MNITSFSFLAFFLAVVFVYYLLPFSHWKRIILLLAGLVFYTSFQPMNLVYLFCIILYSYIMSFFLKEKKNRLLLWVSLVPVISGLFFYKYTYFWPFGVHLQLTAPLGISFFTFKVISYLVDVYQHKIELQCSFLDYSLYVSFFPQISSGPIQRAESFFQKLNEIKKMNIELIRHGFLLVFFGLFEKMVIADRLYLIVNHVFKDNSIWSPSVILIAILAYSFQIYADFDSYSNLAIGIGEMFGISCERNFFAPYLSRNIKEFWNRWHISLSLWLRDYIYLPLGGNRKGLFRKEVNIFIVFLISGLWHGSTWNFVLWGLLNGLYRVLYDLLDHFLFSKIHIRFKPFKWFISCISAVVNFSVVTCLWVFFRFSSLSEIQSIFSYLLQLDFSTFQFVITGIEQSELMITACMTILFILCDVLRNLGFTLHHFGKLFFPVRWCVYAVLLILGIVFAVYGPGYDPSKFIYIQF